MPVSLNGYQCSVSIMLSCSVINGEMCSGNGQCDDCGQCQCTRLEVRRGIFLECVGDSVMSVSDRCILHIVGR